MEKKIKSKIEIKLTEGERDLLYFYLLGVYGLEDIETFEEYPAVVDKLEESITEVAKSTRREEDKKLYIAVEEILSDYHIGVFTDAFYITKLVELFKNLLLEREREVLDKLNKKK